MGKAPPPLSTRGASRRDPYPRHPRNPSPVASQTRLKQGPINERPSGAWTNEDDEQLMKARATGSNWGPIAETHFPHKTANACRKRHERLIEKQKNENWDGIKIEDLAQAYLELREEMWKPLAQRFNEKWQIIESKCMEKGVKNLVNTGRRSSRTKGQSASPIEPQSIYQAKGSPEVLRSSPRTEFDSGVGLDGNSSLLNLHQSSLDHSGSSSSPIYTSSPGPQHYINTTYSSDRLRTRGSGDLNTPAPLEPTRRQNILPLPDFRAFTNALSYPNSPSGSLAYCTS